MLARGLIRLASAARPGSALSIFIFHRVLVERDPLRPWEPDAAQFDWMLRVIASGFDVMRLGEAVTLLRQDRLPRRAAAITFDDGYADNCTVALPILQRHGLSATCFVATSFLDGGRMWNDDVIEAFRIAPDGSIDLGEFDLGAHEVSDAASRVRCHGIVLARLKYFAHDRRAAVGREIAHRAGVEDRSTLMMSSQQVRDLHAAGIEIGGHTHSHPILESLPDREAEREIVEGRDRLAALTGARISLFAYPNGTPGKDYSARHLEIVMRAGFDAAVTTSVGVARRGADVYQLPRYMPWGRTPAKFAVRCARRLLNL